MSHLSELSVQLRKLQAEKNAQANEIDRLQRQLRILSELKGISIEDLMSALKAACEAEAHGEMRAIVGKLQAQVEGLELGGGGGRVAGMKGGNFDDDDDTSYIGTVSGIPTQQQFNEESAKRARAALELKIGELQEIEATLRAELDGLYRNTQQLTERNTYLETQVLQQKAQLDAWERRWKAKEEEELRRTSMIPAPTSASNGSYNYSDFARTDNGHMVPSQEPILLHNALQSEIDVETEARALAAEAALKGEKQQRALVVKQLSSTQKSYQLKVEQAEARIQFVEGQLHDLEQQLKSLYAAFGIMQDDNKEEQNRNAAWRQTLLESDEAVAKEQAEQQKRGQTSAPAEQAPATGRRNQSRRHPSNSSGYRPSFNKLLNPPVREARSAVKPAAHPPVAKGHLMLLLDKDNQPLKAKISGDIQTNDNNQRRLSSSRKLPLKLKKSASKREPKYKRQFCVLHGANGLYQIRYGDTYTGEVAGVCEFITAGVSSIDHTSRSSNKQFGFEVLINPCDMEAPALCCAAESEEDFMMWMSSLTSVIDGSIDSKPRAEV